MHIATGLKNDKLTCNIIFCKPNYNLCSTWAQVKTSTKDGHKLKLLPRMGRSWILYSYTYYFFDSWFLYLSKFKYIYDKSSLKFERIVFFEINKLFMNILKIIMGIKNPIIIPKVELNITDILVVSIVWVLVLYAISIKDDNVNAIEIIHPK